MRPRGDTGNLPSAWCSTHRGQRSGRQTGESRGGRVRLHGGPIDPPSARTAIRQRAREMQANHTRRHPHPQPTPGREDLPRWDQVTVSQLRTGCPLTRVTLASDPLCRECGPEDTVEHFLIAPWWGGFWERLVGVNKKALKITLHLSRLSYDELMVTLYDLALHLNLRPFTPGTERC